MRASWRSFDRQRGGRPLVVTAALVLATACAGGGSAAPTPAAPATEAPASQAPSPTAEAFPVTIENCGQSLTFEAPPQRIVTYYQPTLELVIALGLQDRVVGKGGFNESPVLPEQQAAFDAVPTLFGENGTGFAPPKEILLNAEPDLVINNDQSDYSFSAANGFATRKELAASGIPVYTFTARCDAQNPGTFTDISTDLRNIAAIFGVPERAEPVVEKMEATLARVRDAVGERKPVPVVFYDTGFEGTLDTVYGSGEIGDIVGAAGGRNLFEDVRGSTEVSVEAVSARAPEVWVVLSYDGGPSDEEKRQRIVG